MPRRLQRSRAKGFQMPDGAVYVGRPSIWGNPYPWQGDWITWASVAIGYRADEPGRRAAAVALHRWWLTAELRLGPLMGNGIAGDLVQFHGGRQASIDALCRETAGTLAQLSDDGPPDPLPPRPDLAPLRGRDLACWCPLDAPCHADTLLELANA